MDAPELTHASEVLLRVKFMQFLEKSKLMISKTGYLACAKQVSIVDVCAYSEISQTKFLCLNLAEVREVKDWFGKLSQFI